MATDLSATINLFFLTRVKIVFYGIEEVSSN